MATRNDQREMFEYLQSLYYQTQVNRGPNSASAGRIPTAEGVPVGWMQLMGGVPSVDYSGVGYVGAPDWMTADKRRAEAAKTAKNQRDAYNQMRRAEEKQARQAARAAAQPAAPPPSFNPLDFVPQYTGPPAQQQSSNQVGYNPDWFRNPYSPEALYDRQQAAAAQPVPQGPTLNEQLAQSYLDQINAANQANKERYNQGLGLAIGSRDRNMERIEELGAQQNRDIRADYNRAGKAEYANLVGRGLAGSTVAGAVQRRVLDEQTQNTNRLEDFLARQRIDTDANLTRNIQDFIERRNDVAPDLSMLAQLSRGLGQGNNGQGYGYIPQTQGLYQTGDNMAAVYNNQGYQPQPYQPPTSTVNQSGNDFLTGPPLNYYQRLQQQASNPMFNPFGGRGPMGRVAAPGNQFINPEFGTGSAGGGALRNPAYNYDPTPGYGPGPGGLSPRGWGGYGAMGGGTSMRRLRRSSNTAPIDYAAAAQFQQSLQAPQQSRYQPTYQGGGGGYGGYRPLQTMPGPQFVNARNMFAIPGASYGVPQGVSGYYTPYGAGGNYGGGGGGVAAPQAPTRATGGQQRNMRRQVLNAFNPIGATQVAQGANQLGQLFGQASNYLGRLF